jgi:ribokinase
VESARCGRSCDVAVVGDYCVDLILTGNVRPCFGQVEQIVDDGSLEIGGSAAIFASQLAKLGARVKAVGLVGNDVFGRLVTEALSTAGADISDLRAHATLKTGIGVALSEPEDRAILTYMGTIDAMRPEELDESLLASCRHFHLSVYFLMKSMRSFWPSWFAMCRERGITTSLDTNWDPDNRWEGVEELLSNVDVFLPNEREALAVSRETDVELAGERLAERGTMVVIKRGPDGATAYRGDQRWHLSPDRDSRIPKQVVDATGAGDNFNAGFLRGWLLGWQIPACLSLGHRCAIGSLEYPGGTRGQTMDRSVADMSDHARRCDEQRFAAADRGAVQSTQRERP